MSKVQVEANELKDATVQFVSIVGRPANRLPFKMAKSEGNQMINLHKLFKFETPKPAVAALIVSKGADLEKAKTRIKAAGFSVERPVEQDSVVIFQQGEKDAPLEDAVLIKFDDEIAAACINIAKGFCSYNFESTSFKEMLATEGFWPTVAIAKDVLGYSIANAMEHSKSAEEAAGTISTLISDFQAYVTALVSHVPMQAFKMEGGKPAASLSADGPAATEKGDKPETAAAGDTGTSTATEKAEGDASAGDGSSTSGAGAKDGTPKEAPKATEKAEGDKPGEPDKAAPAAGDGGTVLKSEDMTALITETVSKTVKDLLGGVADGLTAKITALGETLSAKVDAVQKSADEAKTLAKSATDALGTTVIADAGNGDAPKNGAAKTQKGEDDWGAFEIIDTAYHRPQ